MSNEPVIQRWEPCYDEFCEGGPYKEKNGDFVKYTDHLEVIKDYQIRLDALRKAKDRYKAEAQIAKKGGYFNTPEES